VLAISRLTGWAALARFYAAKQPFEGTKWRFQSGSMRFQSGYNNCLTIGANTIGLFVSVLFLFRPGHPPLLIPWNEITTSERTVLWIKIVELRFRSVPNVPLRLRGSLMDKVRKTPGVGLWAELAPASSVPDIPPPLFK
jgi:hypothetical protein